MVDSWEQDPLEKDKATHSTILPWRIPRTEEPGGLQSTKSQRAGPNLANNNSNGILFLKKIKTVFSFHFII